MKPLSELPEYMAAWKLVHGIPLAPDDDAGLPGGTVRGDYLASVVRDVVQQAGSISDPTRPQAGHPASLRADPEHGYVLDCMEAFDHGQYEHNSYRFTDLWEASVRYVVKTWTWRIRGVAVSWPGEGIPLG